MKDQAQMMPVVIVLPPEIDVTNSAEVYDQLAAALGPDVRTVIADLTSTSFCDSSGVRALMHAYESADARDIRLLLAVSPQGSVRRVLQLTGAGLMVPVYPSISEAMGAA